MAKIWVIFDHSVVISKKEKWPADVGTRIREPRLACPNANNHYTWGGGGLVASDRVYQLRIPRSCDMG